MTLNELADKYERKNPEFVAEGLATEVLMSAETTQQPAPFLPAGGGWPVMSLFSGAGGFDLGFRSVGFLPRLAVDFEPAAVETYQKNHPGTAVALLDLSKTKPTDLVKRWNAVMGSKGPRGIIGGPPCQAFSISNVHQRTGDPRYKLLPRYAGIIEAFASELGLDFFVFENVPGLIQLRHQRRYKLFKTRCESAGFCVSEKVVDAGNFGIPQHRRRLIIVGINKKRFPDLKLDVPEGDKDPLTTRAAFEGIPEPIYACKGLKADEVPFHPNHIAMVPRSPKFTNGQLAPGDRRGRSFRVLEWDSPSYTVAYGHREVHIHPDRHRRLSVYEAMVLQGFPKWYELKGTLSQQIQLVSDALPPPLGQGIARMISSALRYDAESANGAPGRQERVRHLVG